MPIDEFLTLDFFKTMVNSTDTQDDSQYLQFVDDSNGKVQTAISRYIDTPIGEGSVYFSRCQSAALSYARSLHAIDIQLVEKSKAYVEQYNTELYGSGGTEGRPMAGGLIQELIATRNNRTITVLARHDPRDFKVPLPTQNDLFASQRFG
jgi:hypothetical protein